MRITRDRYLDDSNRWHLAIEALSRTPEMHSAIDALSPAQRDALGDVLVEALDKAARIIEPVAVQRGARPVQDDRTKPPRG
jgi:hypothetical protein